LCWGRRSGRAAPHETSFRPSGWCGGTWPPQTPAPESERLTDWLRRLLGRPGVAQATSAGPPGDGPLPDDALWAVVPPRGVRLLGSVPSRTGEGGRGVLARYSDGTTASAMVNSDGSVRVLFFRGTEPVPAVPLDGPGPSRYTWTTGA
jgi:hypothetical protein